MTARLEQNHFPNAHLVLVEYDGRLVYEKYLSGEDQNWDSNIGHVTFAPDVKHDLRSITKSVTALLLGIALERTRHGQLDAALSTSIMDYFPEYADEVDDAVRRITLAHILNMTDGLEWNEMEVPYSNQENDEIQLYYNPDPFAYVLEKPVRSAPGKSWYYNGGDTMLLAGVIQHLTGKTLREFE